MSLSFHHQGIFLVYFAFLKCISAVIHHFQSRGLEVFCAIYPQVFQSVRCYCKWRCFSKLKFHFFMTSTEWSSGFYPAILLHSALPTALSWSSEGFLCLGHAICKWMQFPFLLLNPCFSSFFLPWCSGGICFSADWKRRGWTPLSCSPP